MASLSLFSSFKGNMSGVFSVIRIGMRAVRGGGHHCCSLLFSTEILFCAAVFFCVRTIRDALRSALGIFTREVVKKITRFILDGRKRRAALSLGRTGHTLPPMFSFSFVTGNELRNSSIRNILSNLLLTKLKCHIIHIIIF